MSLRINEMKGDTPPPIVEALTEARIKIGSTHIVDNKQLKILIDYLKKNCGFIYPEEIPKAFDLAIEGKFEYIEPSSLAHMKTRFTQAFLASIMRPYLKWRGNQQQKPVRDVSKDAPGLPMDEYLEKHLYKPYKELLDTGVYPYQEWEEVCLYNTVTAFLGVSIPITENIKLLAQKENRKGLFDSIADAAEKRLAFRYWIQNKAENLEMLK